MIIQCLKISMAVIKILPHPPEPLGGIKDQILKFRNNSVSCQNILLNFACRQRYTKYETYQT